MLSAVSLLSHASTIAVTRPAPRGRSSVARDTVCGDPVTVNLMTACVASPCYTRPVVQPVGSRILTPARRRVKRRAVRQSGPPGQRWPVGSRSDPTPPPSSADRPDSRRIEPTRKARVGERIADRIRGLILDGTFPAGQPLPAERPLAQRFGVSRGSIRDALRTLETIGLLVTRHGQGTFPQELHVDRLVAPLASILSYRRDLQEELLDVRRMFEPAVARVAATRVTAEDLAELERLLGAQRRKLKTGRSAIAEDTAFHEVLARATRNRVVVSIMATLNDLLEESRKHSLSQEGRPGRSMRGHKAVVAALQQRDAGGAAEAMREHIDQIADLLHRPPSG